MNKWSKTISTVAPTQDFPSVAIVLVNYHGSNDTIECLESLLQLSSSRFSIIVVDNFSQDGSLDRIAQWARGKYELPIVDNRPINDNLEFQHTKPIPFAIVTEKSNQLLFQEPEHVSSLLYLIQSTTNRGYATGNNIGIEFALKSLQADFVWLLNNDTVVHPDSLQQLLVKSLRDHTDMTGSTLCFYHAPKTLQAKAGARYHKWFALSFHIGENESLQSYNSNDECGIVLDYINGASMLVTRSLIETVGLMSEEYFLYCEEIDWAVRAKRKGYKLGWASKSIVYHKEGASTGASNHDGKKTLLVDYFSNRNRLIVTRKYFPLALPTVYLALLITIIRRVMKRRWKNALMLARMIVGIQPKSFS